MPFLSWPPALGLFDSASAPDTQGAPHSRNSALCAHQGHTADVHPPTLERKNADKTLVSWFVS